MGLTDSRKTAKNLADSRKNWKILLTYGCVFYFPASVTPYAR